MRTWRRPLKSSRFVSLFFAILGLGCGEDAVAPDLPQPPDPPDPPPVPVSFASLLEDSIVVTENPSGRVPLAARVAFQTTDSLAASVRVLGADPLRYAESTTSTSHMLPVLGLLPAEENLVELSLALPDGRAALDTVRITPAPLPDYFPVVEVTTADSVGMEPGWTLSSLSVGDGGEFRTIPIWFDHQGRIRWYMDLSDGEDMGFAMERLANGNLLIGQGRAIFEYDMFGEQINRWPMPGYWYHHDVIEAPDGNLLVAVIKLSASTIEDHVIELDRSSGAIVNEWDLRQVLDVSRRTWGGTATDWFHMNAIWADPADGGLILSGQRQGLVKIDREGNLKWILAPHRGWGPAGPEGSGPDTAPFLLTAVDASGTPYPDSVQDGGAAVPGFDWTWGQHGPQVLPNGNVLVFDNGLNRRFVNDPTFSVGYSRAVEYRIDAEAMTVEQVWEWGSDRGQDYYAAIISDVDYLPITGNRLVMPGIVFNSGPRAFVTEVTEAGQVVFEAQIKFRNALSSGEPRWGDFDLVYRSERLPLYP